MLILDPEHFPAEEFDGFVATALASPPVAPAETATPLPDRRSVVPSPRIEGTSDFAELRRTRGDGGALLHEAADGARSFLGEWATEDEADAALSVLLAAVRLAGVP